MAQRDWNPDEVKAALDTELAVHDDRNTEDIAKRKMRESVAYAADRLIHLALYSDNESVSLKASTYLMDRVFGRVTDMPITGTEEDSLAQFLKGVVSNS